MAKIKRLAKSNTHTDYYGATTKLNVCAKITKIKCSFCDGVCHSVYAGGML